MDSGGETSAPPMEVTFAAPETVVDYVANVAVVLMGAPNQGADVKKALEKSDALTKFITDPREAVLVVDRTIQRDQSGEVDTGDESDANVCVFDVSNAVQYKTERSVSVVFIKRGVVIEADKNIAKQIRVMPLNEGSAYDTLWSIIAKAINPYFKSYIKKSGRGERDGDKLGTTVEKNLAEAEVALLHLQQNIHIRDITLVINPVIMAAIEKARKEGRKATAEDLHDHIEDSSFLNTLQKGVNRWIQEIRKVTKLERDPSSGTSLQEMTFWLNLERSLQKISEKRESEEVTLTLEALKSGKRFQATVAFDTDTGLKEKINMVTDYNSLMKDFPLNELISATDMAAIKTALGNIFNHMKKIRSTKYPVQRTLRFVEATSRDLNTQILKVLGTRRLMHISATKFDVLMTVHRRVQEVG